MNKKELNKEKAELISAQNFVENRITEEKRFQNLAFSCENFPEYDRAAIRIINLKIGLANIAKQIEVINNILKTKVKI